MSEAKRRIVTLLAQAKSDHQAEYKQRLAQALREIREQHNVKVQRYKDDLEQSYRARVRTSFCAVCTLFYFYLLERCPNYLHFKGFYYGGWVKITMLLNVNLHLQVSFWKQV